MKNNAFLKFKTLLICFVIANNFSNAQNSSSDILMTVNGTKVTLSEFENVYHKNNSVKTTTEKSLDEYVDLFVIFKMKVKEAEESGLDTAKKFKDELAGYRRQLAQPYLTDREVNEKLLRETYDRYREEVCASHILIKCSEIAAPKDTLVAYNKALKIYNRIQKGESFEKLASEKGISDDTMLISRAGYLGCFTALDLVYPFETAAYNTKVGEVSKPVRTRFGYHIIKVNNRRPARGEVKLAHIMLKNPPRMSQGDSLNQEKKINEIYAKLKAGKKFEAAAAEYSDDKQTAQNGGELQWIGINRTPATFEDAAFALKNKGDFSAPVRTPYGVHIIKLIDKKEMGEYNDVKNDIKQKLVKASRYSAGHDAFILKLKKEYNFSENHKNLEETYSLIDSSIFSAKWSKEKTLQLNKELFSFGDKKLTQSDFFNFISTHQKRIPKTDIKIVVNDFYKQFVDELLLNYEDSRLEEKYAEFRNLMQEYRDGILLFELTDNKVWSKAVKDSAGLHKFYEENKSKYSWGERAETSIYSCSNKESADLVRKLLKTGSNANDILIEVNKSSQLNLTAETKEIAKGENEFVDKNWKVGISDNIISPKDNKILVLNIIKIDMNSLKTFDEAKGAIISDYQNYLEKQWISELKNKYSVNIDKNVLAKVK